MTADKTKSGSKGTRKKPASGSTEVEKIAVLRMMDPKDTKKVTSTFRLRKNRVVIGSVVSADIQIDKPGVSPLHAVIEVNKDTFAGSGAAIIYDLASEVGTKVNNKKAVTETINPGDKIKIGDVVLKFELEDLTQEVSPLALGMFKGMRDKLDPDTDYKSIILDTSEDIEEIFDYRPAHKKALEVVMSWNGIIIDVKHFPTGKLVNVGDKIDCDFAIPPILGKGKRKLVSYGNKGLVVHLSDGMTGMVQTHGSVSTVEEVRESLTGSKRGYQVDLNNDDFAKISVGEVDFYISCTATPPKLKDRPFLKREPLFHRFLAGSILFTLLFILLLMQIPIRQTLEAEQLPERVATILYQPEKYSYLFRQRRGESEDPADTKVPKPMPRRTTKVEIMPTGMPKVMSRVLRTGPRAMARRPRGMQRAIPKAGREGEGTRRAGAMGAKGPRAMSSGGKSGMVRATRPSPRGGKGRGGSRSRVEDQGNLDMLRGVGKRIEDLLGGSAQKLGKSGKKLRGFGAFNQPGSGGAALSGKGVGGGGTDARGLGLGKKGRGAGRVGTGLGAVGTGTNIIGGKVRVALNTGGPRETVVLGSIDRGLIEAKLLEYRDEFRLCYEREINAGQPKLSGRVTTSFVIGSSGSVNKAGIASSTLRSRNTERCIVRVIKRIQFPKPRGGGIVQVKYPFKFRAVGS